MPETRSGTPIGKGESSNKQGPNDSCGSFKGIIKRYGKKREMRLTTDHGEKRNA